MLPAPPTTLSEFDSFAEVPAFHFDEGGSNVPAHHELSDGDRRNRPWKKNFVIQPAFHDDRVMVGVHPGLIYVADSGDAGA
jgi:hypothetical protein